MKTPNKQLKTFTIAKMVLSPLKIYRILKKNSARSFWTLPISDIFNIYFILFYMANFLSLQLWTYAERISTKHWPKPKNFVRVDWKMLSMKDEMLHFAPGLPIYCFLRWHLNRFLNYGHNPESVFKLPCLSRIEISSEWISSFLSRTSVTNIGFFLISVVLNH